VGEKEANWNLGEGGKKHKGSLQLAGTLRVDRNDRVGEPTKERTEKKLFLRGRGGGHVWRYWTVCDAAKRIGKGRKVRVKWTRKGARSP